MYARRDQQERKLYYYNGAVMVFDRIVDRKWEAQTRAVSPKQAASNFAYQFKKIMGYESNAKVSLCDKIVSADDGCCA